MTVSSGIITNGPYLGAGTTDTFDYTFTIQNKNQLLVYETDDTGAQILLTVDTDYTVTGVGESAGTAVRTAGNLPTDYEWYIKSNYLVTQSTGFRSQGSFFPGTHEDAFDKLTYLLLQMQDSLSRSLSLSESYSGVLPLSVESPVAHNIQRWKSDLSGLENIDPDTILPGSFVPLDFVKTVTTVATMKTDTSILPGQRVETSGYTTADDEGGAAYLCKTTTQAAADGDVIDGYGNHTATSGHVLILQHNGAPSILQFGARNTTSFDSTGAFQAAVANTSTLTLYKSGDYKVTDESELLADACIILSAGVNIQQFTANKRIFFADNKDNVWIAANGAVLYGEGTWSAGWTGNSGHADRGIELINCTRSGIIKPNVKNMASGGISIIGGDRLFIDSPLIEGTHTYSTVLPASSNFQNGLYLKHDSIEGNITNLSIASPTISGVAQGILIEGYGGLVQTDDMIINILNPIIHDIPGQHGIYCQVGKVNIPSANIDDCELDGIKIQDNGTVNPADVNIPDFNISNCGSHAIEVQAAAAGGSVTFVKGNGVARGCSRGLGINGVTATSAVSNIDIDMMCYNSGVHGAIIQGHASAPISDIDLKITSDISGKHGVFVTAAQATGVRITPKVRKAGGDAANTYDGILIEAATDVDIIHPDVTDSLGNQRYAFYTSSSTALVKVFHKAIFQDGTTHDVRSEVDMEYWPSDVTLSAGTTVSRMHDLKRFAKTTDHVLATNQSTSATNVTLWQSEMPDESAWFLTASVVAKLSDSTDRESWVRTALCYRDAGGNVVIDAQGDIQNLGVSGAVLVWELSGTTIRLRGNSGSAVTYDWKARVSYEDVS